MNRIILSGNLTREPELRVTSTGKTVARLSLAVSRQFSKDATDFFNLTAWDKTAEFCGRYLKKGSAVIVEGRAENDNYEKNGVKHFSINIQVERIEFGERKKETADDTDVPF